MHTGMRRGELLRLTWKDCDWFAGMVKIWKTKNDEPRYAVMNSTIQKALLELKERVKPGMADPIFDFYPRYLGRAFRRAVMKAGIAPFRCDLRHTFASRLAQLGANDRTIMQAGGWKSPAMLNRYCHLSPSSVWQVVEQLAGTGSKTGSTPEMKQQEVAPHEATS